MLSRRLQAAAWDACTRDQRISSSMHSKREALIGDNEDRGRFLINHGHLADIFTKPQNCIGKLLSRDPVCMRREPSRMQ